MTLKYNKLIILICIFIFSLIYIENGLCYSKEKTIYGKYITYKTYTKITKCESKKEIKSILGMPDIKFKSPHTHIWCYYYLNNTDILSHNIIRFITISFTITEPFSKIDNIKSIDFFF